MNRLIKITLVFFGLCVFASAQEEVDRKPLVIHSTMDIGQVANGSNLMFGDLNAVPLMRTGISMVQEIFVQKRLDVKIGVGGLFWYPFPQLAKSPYTEAVKFGPGISMANGTFKFGDLDKPWMSAQFGYFAYKYNPDAMDLGEYLFRSTAYPGLLYTGGWSLINSAAYKTTGLRLSFSNLNGALTNDFTLYFENDVFPFNSLSPGWVGTFKVGKVFEFGAGAVYQHLFAMKPSQLKPKDPLSTYVKLSDFPNIPLDTSRQIVDGHENMLVSKYEAHAAGPIAGIEQEIASMKDANGKQPYLEAASDTGTDTIYANELNPIIPPGYHYVYPRSKEYLTFQGIKVMGRFAMDFKPLLGLEDALGPQDLRLFAEVAVLGVQNQPYYYQDIGKRIPIMVGFNLPTFKLLDLLSVQWEHYGMDYMDSEEESYSNNIPVPKSPEHIANYHSSLKYTKDDNKWSVYAKKSLFQGIDLFCQVADDHMRLPDYQAVRSFQPVLNRPSDWYYLFRLDFGI